MDCSEIEDQLGTQELNHLGPYRQVIIFCNLIGSQCRDCKIGGNMIIFS